MRIVNKVEKPLIADAISCFHLFQHKMLDARARTATVIKANVYKRNYRVSRYMLPTIRPDSILLDFIDIYSNIYRRFHCVALSTQAIALKVCKWFRNRWQSMKNVLNGRLCARATCSGSHCIDVNKPLSARPNWMRNATQLIAILQCWKSINFMFVGFDSEWIHCCCWHSIRMEDFGRMGLWLKHLLLIRYSKRFDCSASAVSSPNGL